MEVDSTPKPSKEPIDVDETDCSDKFYRVKVLSPGGDSLSLQLNAGELVQEIYRILIEREETCTRTCFSLQYNGQTLDLFSEMKSIEDIQDEIEIVVIEEKYNVREARNHVKHIYDLLRSTEYKDAYMGKEQISLSFLTTLTNGDLIEKQVGKPDLTALLPPDYVIPNNSNFGESEPPLAPLHPLNKADKPIVCLKQLNYSNWNPPPPNRKLMGELLYVQVITLEDKKLHITSSNRGFFVNSCTDDEFNPKPYPGATVFHSLIDLLKKNSLLFKKNFEALLNKKASKHPLERIPTPYQVYSWLSPNFEHIPESIRKEEAFSQRMAYEENLPGQTRDWNDEWQMSHDLPREKLTERIIRDKTIFKANSDFIASATRAAVSVVNGDIIAINPGEAKKQQMYIWNNMFFSFGFDIKDHYKEFGGEHAAHVATLIDLNGVRAYSMIENSKLHTLGTAIIDYRGYRVTAQTIIPGILEKEQEELVVYGSTDFGKKVITDSRYVEPMMEAAKQLKIRPHKVISSPDEAEVEMFSSVECKGIVGNDNRIYILDLLRTFPPDVNYLGGSEEEQSLKLPESLTKHGYPLKHVHLLATVRQELVESFIESKHDTFLKIAAKEIKAIQPAPTPSSDEASKPTEEASDKYTIEDLMRIKKVLLGSEKSEPLDEPTKAAIEKAALAVGSLDKEKFSVLFNPDVFHSHVKFPQANAELIEKDKQLIIELCDYLVNNRIPHFVGEISNQTFFPLDGKNLVETMHQKGINVRYLNKVIEEMHKNPRIAYAEKIAVLELLMRSVKHVFIAYVQDLDPMVLSSGVAHFLNCLFLASHSNSHNPLMGMDDLMIKLLTLNPNSSSGSSKKGKKKKITTKSLGKDVSEDLAWTTETPSSLWSSIKKEAKDFYHYDIESKNLGEFCSAHGITRVEILRSLCQKVGIQLALKEYHLTASSSNSTSPTKAPFIADDIVSLQPVVKHFHPHASDAYHCFTTGQTKVASGQINEGFDLINEALGLLNTVYGHLHPDIGTCNRLLARLSYVMGEHQTALVFQQRATIISERVHGIDSSYTAAEYVHFALYAFTCGQIVIALQLLYRARYINLLCHGENHPEMALIDTNIGLMLLVAEEYDLSAVFLENAWKVNTLFNEPQSLKEAFSCHLLSRVHAYRFDFRTAVEYEKQRHNIFKQRLGLDNAYTQECDECLKYLLKKAVTVAKQAQSAKSITARPSNPTSGDDSKTKMTNGKAAGKDTQLVNSKDTNGDSSALNQKLSMLNQNPVGFTGGPGDAYAYPTLSTIMETLNRVNGVGFIQLTQKDIEKLKVNANKAAAAAVTPKVQQTPAKLQAEQVE